VALIVVVALALAVRLAGAGDRLTADEGYSWLVGSAPDVGSFLARLAAFENTPPLFYALLTPLPLDDEVWIRLPSIAAGVASVAALYYAVRALAGSRVGLVAALVLAIAPYHVIFSNYSRGFVLAGLGLVLALWAAARLVRGADQRWWALYAAGAVVALYSEYDAALTLVPLAGALIVAGLRPWRRVALLGLAPLLSLVPWTPELLRSLDKLDETKTAPNYSNPTPGVVRDEIVPLFFGEHGATYSAGVHTLQFLAVVGALALAAWLLWRGEGHVSPGPEPPGVRRPVFWLLAGTAGGALVLHCARGLRGARPVLDPLPDRAAAAVRGVAGLRGGARSVAPRAAARRGCFARAWGRRLRSSRGPRARARPAPRGGAGAGRRRAGDLHEQLGRRVLPETPPGGARPPVRARPRTRAGNLRPSPALCGGGPPADRWRAATRPGASRDAFGAGRRVRG